MNCPNCKTIALSMSERSGIEIDFCPECRGVWLDRGELDKIIEKSAAAQPEPPAAQVQAQHSAPPYQPYATKDYYKYKRKKSFLEEIFD